MLAKAISSILPPLPFDDMIQVSQLYSLVGKLSPEQPLIAERPFRSVHHTASKISIVGGGQQMLPGEISLAHK
jgi:magnesium chelatase family protein